jgi:erythronate-4-phosphate dehydrogenase
MNTRFRLLADEHVYELHSSCSNSIEVQTYDPDLGIPSDAGKYDALLVRTVTKVNSQTLPDTGKLRWVGTASAGMDHLDIPWLESKGIAVGSAAGCNARAVAEYVITMMMVVAYREGWDPWKEKLGIVGVGHVGSALHTLSTGLGLKTVLYDPPRALREPGFVSATIDEVLDTSMLSLHVPLISHGEWETRYWLNADRIFRTKRRLVIQASRGGIVDEQSLKKALTSGWIQSAIVDVWDHEPNFDPELVELAAIATPHVAGYSKQSKLLATQLALNHLQTTLHPSTHHPLPPHPSTLQSSTLQSSPFPSSPFPSSPLQLFNLHPSPLPPSTLLADFLIYDRELREIAKQQDAEQRAYLFRQLRIAYPYRDEYPNMILPEDVLQKWPLWYYLANINV